MISPREWTAHLHAHAAPAGAGIAPEAVHQVRVAAGRLSVWLELGGRRMLRDDLAWLRRSASGTRDLDVVLEQLDPAFPKSTAAHSRSSASIPRGDPTQASALLSPERWSEWRARLTQERAQACGALLEALASTRFRSLQAALAWMPPLDAEVARAALRHFRRRVARADERLKHAGSDLGSLHRLRRAVRRMRYALEWVGDDARAWKALQDDLGALNDLAILQRHLDGDVGAARVHEDDGVPRAESRLPCAVQVEQGGSSALNGSSRPRGSRAPGDAASNGHASPREIIQREIAARRTRFLEDWSRAVVRDGQDG